MTEGHALSPRTFAIISRIAPGLKFRLIPNRASFFKSHIALRCLQESPTAEVPFHGNPVLVLRIDQR